MQKYYNKIKKGFTIVELVIVIAVIAVLSSVLVPTFSNVIDKAQQSNALNEAVNAWKDISMTYVNGYNGFKNADEPMNGWYYDYIDGIAKFEVDEKYMVTYNGVDFNVLAYDGSAWIYDEVKTASIDYTSNFLGEDPFALTITYYDGIFTRGFSWMTSLDIKDGEFYLVESNKGELAPFTYSDSISVANINRTNYYSHSVHVLDLKPNTVYSYKAGTEGHYKYGTFKTEVDYVNKIKAISLTDAQTKDPTKLNVWENTMAQAVETAGVNLDMILYNGDQFDSNMSDITMNRHIRYGLARELVNEYVHSLPYMSASGNHENAKSEASYVQYYNNEIAYSRYTESGCMYSFDYDFAHFVVLNSNDTSDVQKDKLISDLEKTDADWIVVMMHNGPYATGDHSNGSATQKIIEKYTPIFSKYHVDLVIQGHDHTFNKTLPYKWDSYGYYDTKTPSTYALNSVVNFDVTSYKYNGFNYDLNPNGTYYVTIGSAGHRVGESEGDAGIWADVEFDGTNITPLSSSASYLQNKYKIESGKLVYSSSFKAFDYKKDTLNYHHDQVFNAGDPATGNVNAQMFGVLELTKNTLVYNFYTVNGNNVKLFDELRVYKN